MNWLFLFTSPPLTVAFAAFFTAALRLPSRPARWAALFVLAYANIVLIAQIAGTIYQLGNHAVWIGLQGILAAAGVGVWWRVEKPGSRSVGTTWQVAPVLERAKHISPHIRTSIKHCPDLWLLGCGVAAAYFMATIVILVVPPNNWDGMAYRLARVGYWLQHDSFYTWQTDNPRQTSFPQNAEIGLLWTILICGTDQFAGFVQWAAALTSMAVVFGLSRLLGYTRHQSGFAALIWATLPLNFAEATSIQNDLVVGVFFAAAVYFLFLGLQTRRSTSLLVSGIALGLSIGTKSTALLMLPGLGLVVFIFWMRNPPHLTRLLVVWGSACIVGTIVFGSYVYVMNMLAYKRVLGPAAFADSHLSADQSRLDLLATNAPRYLYQLADLTGLPYAASKPFIAAKRTVFTALVDDPAFETHLDFWHWGHEDTAWFGPLGFLVLLPGLWSGTRSLFFMFRAEATPSQQAAHRHNFRLSLAILFVSFWIVHSAMQEWTPFKGRYYVLAVIAAAPLMTWLYRPRWMALRWGCTLLALVVLACSLFFNPRKPVIGANAIWDKSPIERRTLTSQDQAPTIIAVERFVPADGTLGMAVAGEWVFPYFGAQLNRLLIPLDLTKGFSSLDGLAHSGVTFLVGDVSAIYAGVVPDYLLVNNRLLNHITDTTGYEQLAQSEILTLFRRTAP